MISTVKTKEGLIYGYLEFQILDGSGQQSERGEYVYVRAIWAHPDYRYLEVYKELIWKINKHPFTRRCPFVYWEIVRDLKGKKIIDDENREVGTRRLSKIYKKEYILNKLFKRELV